MKEIKLSQHGKHKGKYVALVDDEDFEWLNQFKWCVMKCRRIFYAARRVAVEGKLTWQFMHGVILNRKMIDHRDGNGLNNQRNNLRFCTVSENQMNTRKQENKSSIYKGVYFHKANKKWRAYITINGKRTFLGYFKLETDAAKAYNAKAIELFCEFANLNDV